MIVLHKINSQSSATYGSYKGNLFIHKNRLNCQSHIKEFIGFIVLWDGGRMIQMAFLKQNSGNSIDSQIKLFSIIFHIGLWVGVF